MRRSLALLLIVLLSGAPTFAIAQEVPEQVLVVETPIEAVTNPTEVLTPSEEPVPPSAEEVEELSGTYVEGEVIVKYKDSRIDLESHTDQQEANSIVESLSMETMDVIEGMNMAVVETTGDTTVAEAITELESNPAVEYAEPNYVRFIETLASTSVELANSWALQNTGQTVNGVTGTLGADIDALLAWDMASGTEVTVAVIDTGVDYTHPELADSMWDGSTCVSETGTTSWSCTHGYDFEYDTSDPRATTTDSTGSHGTHVAGIIAAGHNDVGVVGIAYGANIMALRFGLDTASEIRAIDFAIANGVQIINASYGGDTFSQAEYDAIERFQNAGGLFVASAGNSGEDLDAVAEPAYPASYDLPAIVSVAATDAFDSLTSYSNFGATSVDLAAPGSHIRSTIPLGGYSYKSGTSMSAPYVSGVAALLWSYDPTLTAAEVKTALMDSGDSLASLSGKTVSGKRLNAYNALASIVATTTEEILDTEAPVITLIGNNPMNLTVGDPFTDPGATVTDNVDATTTIAGVGTVDMGVAGTYTLTYNAADTAGNAATTTTRSVVVAAPVVSSGGGGGGGGSSTSSRRGGGGGGGSTITRATTPVSVARPLTTITTPQVLGAATYTFARDLSAGSTGSDVTQLQQTLAALGLYTGPITGYFGPLTASAVSAFQTARGLQAVGRVGPQTRALLNQGHTGNPVTLASTAPTMADMQAKLASLLAQLAALQATQ
jgi:subtilisin family serine protease